MRIIKCLCINLILLTFSSSSWAMYIDVNVLPFTDTLKTTTTSVTSRSMNDIGIGAYAGKSNQLAWTINFGSGSFSDKSTTTSTFTFSDLGFKMVYFLNKQKTWTTSITYNLESKAKYNDGTSSAELRGSSFKIDIGHINWVNESFGIGIKIFYYAPSYKESISSNTLTTINYNRTIIAPNLGVFYLF